MTHSMDQISIKTPNPKCRLHWRLIEFIDWRYKSVMLVFSIPLVNYRPLTFSLVTCIHTVCNGGGGSGASDR